MRRLKVLASAPVIALASALMLTACAADSMATAAPAQKPKLVVMITVDQLRGDMPWRFKDRFTGGLKWLMDNGIAYSNAHYRHSTTFTAVGHATLATGGNGAQHGLAGNDWTDPATGERVYCVEDQRNPLIGTKVDAKTKHRGTSPRNLTSSTIGDELVIASGYKTRVFSVSIKDRGAILPGGQFGKAFWYSSGSGKFVTSTYYYDKYPAWVDAWNKADHAGKYQNVTWNLKQDKSKYIYADNDNRPGEKGYKHLKATFPHKLGAAKKKDMYAALRFAPQGDEYTLAFAKEVLKQEKLGQGKYTDMLAVSLSALDYLGHAWGPNSLEYEDMLMWLDSSLGDFFGYIDKTVGLDKTLIFLSADHGIDEVPENIKTGFYMTRNGEGAGRHDPKRFILKVNNALQKHYNTKENFIHSFWNPSLYLNMKTVEKLKLNVAEVETRLRDEIMKVDGIAIAATRTDLLAGRVVGNPIMDKLQRSFHPTRSGNVLFIQEQGWYLYPNVNQFAAMHGSPYSYDTYVPIMFAGPGIKHGVVNRLIGPEDIAATVAAYLGTKPPSGSTGDVLNEVVDGLK